MVVTDRAQALELVASGCDVVLIVGPGEDAPETGGPGRLAVFVGGPGDPAVAAAAEEMDRELFRPTA